MEKGFSISLRGGAHLQNGKPMQDYSGAERGDGYDIAVVCDGHGSDKHFRSHVGSRLATEAAIAKLKEFATAYPDYASASAGFGKKAEILRLSIVSAWMKGIEKDYTEEPFTPEELKKGVAPGVDYYSRYTKLVPYGTTMLAVLLAKDYYVALMIGDGVIIRMTPDTEAVEESFEGKKLGDRVESMCNQDSAFKIYSKCVKIEDGERDMAFVLASDGFCESEAFTSREMMRNWPKRYITVMAKYGMEKAKEMVAAQMQQISDVSSAMDDISVAIAVKNPDAYIEAKKAEDSAPETADESSADEKTDAPAPEAAESSAPAADVKPEAAPAPTDESKPEAAAAPTEENKPEAAPAENEAAPAPTEAAAPTADAKPEEKTEAPAVPEQKPQDPAAVQASVQNTDAQG